MKLIVQRDKTTKEKGGFTTGQMWDRDDPPFSFYTLEDEIRKTKVYAESAIPAGLYRLELIDSPKFGPDSLWIRNIPGFEGILIHGGVTEKHTAGCILIGNRIDREEGLIYGATPKSGAKDVGELAKLKERVKAAIQDGQTVEIEVMNHPEDKFVDTGELIAN
jgi:hypothetical protein